MIRPSPGGRFNADNIALNLLIQLAYNVQDFQISGGPSWMKSDRFDITAKAESSATFDQMRPMIQSLLAERFKLTIHREKKETSVYELTAAKGGIKIVAAKEGSCITFDPAKNSGPPPPPKPGETLPRICGGVRMSVGLIDGFGISTTELAADLSNMLGRTVVDKTGFTGAFDVHLEFTPDAAPANGAFAQAGPGAPPPANSSVPSIFTALQEQLGLRLESAKGPVEVLVIDHLERPSEN